MRVKGWPPPKQSHTTSILIVISAVRRHWVPRECACVRVCVLALKCVGIFRNVSGCDEMKDGEGMPRSCL